MRIFQKNLTSAVALTVALTATLGASKSFAQSKASADQTAEQYETLSKHRRYPKDLGQNSSAQIFDSVGAFAREFPFEVKNLGDQASGWQGRQLLLNEKIPQKWRGLWVLHSTVEKALIEEENIPQDVAFEVGILAQRALAQAQSLNWTEYRQSLNQIFNRELIPLHLHLDHTFQTLLNSVTVDHTYQIPYLAGYSKLNAHKIYIDRGIKPFYQMKDGQEMNVSLELTIHELVEKSLIDWTQLSTKIYLRTHQIAQRIEKAMTLFYGYSWNDYQNSLMQKEIDRADAEGRSDATLVRVPQDLDLTPYIDYQEWDMIARMKRAAQP